MFALQNPRSLSSNSQAGLRILVVGATGFIGSAVCARLAAQGHNVFGAGRAAPPATIAPMTGYRRIDVLHAKPEDWLAVLDDMDAVVNCAGVLQNSSNDSVYGVHARGAVTLYEACQSKGVRRIVHLSAAGVEARRSDFSKSKLAGDQWLLASDLDWIILRPSVVVGNSAFGGSALLRGLAALPFTPDFREAGKLQLVHLEDVADTVAICVQKGIETRQILELVGPREYTFAEAIELIRNWLRWPRRIRVSVPGWMAAVMYKAGDVLAVLGWRTPVRTTARYEMAGGATGSAARWREVTGLVAKDIRAQLFHHPASVQERWFASLYLLKPLVFGVFGLFWIATGLVSLGPGWEIGKGLMREGGAPDAIAAAAVISGAFVDIAIGCFILYRPTSRIGLYAALFISFSYAVIGTILLPRLWSEPLGPMLKIWPIIVLNMVALAIRDDR